LAQVLAQAKVFDSSWLYNMIGACLVKLQTVWVLSSGLAALGARRMYLQRIANVGEGSGEIVASRHTALHVQMRSTSIAASTRARGLRNTTGARAQKHHILWALSSGSAALGARRVHMQKNGTVGDSRGRMGAIRPARAYVAVHAQRPSKAFAATTGMQGRAFPIRMGNAPLTGPVAFLTRENGKNTKLEGLLTSLNIPSEELPCITFERQVGFGELCALVKQKWNGWVVITSPEAASVFVDALRASDVLESRSLHIASVGAGTAKTLSDAGLYVEFVPSKATATVLAEELPQAQWNLASSEVLYPASVKAANTLEDGLAARGFRVRRVNTYTTVPAEWTLEELRRAEAASVVTFASPTAVRVWADRAGTDAIAVCIGETSAEAARRAGFRKVLFPDSPSVESWADTVAKLGIWNAEAAEEELDAAPKNFTTSVADQAKAAGLQAAGAHAGKADATTAINAALASFEACDVAEGTFKYVQVHASAPDGTTKVIVRSAPGSYHADVAEGLCEALRIMGL